MMKINDMFKNNNGEVAKVVEIDEIRKTCMIEINGTTKQLSFSTLKDKRRWNLVTEDDQYVAEIMEQKKDLGIECPKIESFEIISEAKRIEAEIADENDAYDLENNEGDYCADGTSYAQIGKEIAEQAKIKAEEASNKKSNRKLIEYNSKSLTLHGWAKELGVPFGTLYARVTRFNWTYEEALSGVKNKKED